MVSQSAAEPASGGAAAILGSALELFGAQGVSGTSLKAIAARAGVSQALIVHHFGSKDGLRAACDEYAAGAVRTSKREAMAQGPNLNPLAAMAAIEEYRPVLRYLARTLTDGSPHVNALVDEMVADAEEYTAEGERQGLIVPSSDPRARVVVLLLQSLGVLVLHEHLARLLGEDVVGEGPPPMRYMHAVLDVFCDGVLTEGAYAELRAVLDEGVPPGAPTDPADTATGADPAKEEKDDD